MEGSKIWGIAILKTDSMLPQEKFVSPDRILFWAEIFCAYSSVIYITLFSSEFFDLSNRRFKKKIDLYGLLCFDRFLPFYIYASKTHSFLVLLGKRDSLRVATVAYVILDVFLTCQTEPKLEYCFEYTNATNENCVWVLYEASFQV